MAEIFTPEWTQSFKTEWNNEAQVSGALAQIAFSVRIGYGFKDEGTARCLAIVDKGTIVTAGKYEGESLDWDIRASADDWAKWCSDPPNLMTVQMSYTAGKLKFVEGDFAGLIRDPRLAMPFVKMFEVIGRA